MKIEFKDNQNAAQSIEQTIYIPVRGSGADSVSGLSITDINAPKQVLAGEDFILNFKVVNNGDNSTGQVNVYAEAQSGLVNRTQNAFIEKSIAPGENRSYSITYFTTEGAAETSYTIKLVVEQLSGDGKSIQQYTGIYVKKGTAGSIKTPQLYVSALQLRRSFDSCRR